MVDTIGPQTFPLGSPEPLKTSGDPALGYLAQYLQLAVNAACDSMWGGDGVCPGRQTVGHVFMHDPKKLFEENRLPALYIWRGKSTRSRMADEMRKKTSSIQIAWINESASEDHLVARDNMMNAIADAIDMVISKDRDPEWKMPGDTDPLTVRRGSSLSKYCGWSRSQPSDDTPQELLFQRIEEAAPLPYYGFVMSVEVDEYQDHDDNDRFAYAPKLDAGIRANAPLTVATIATEDRAIWEVP